MTLRIIELSSVLPLLSLCMNYMLIAKSSMPNLLIKYRPPHFQARGWK